MPCPTVPPPGLGILGQAEAGTKAIDPAGRRPSAFARLYSRPTVDRLMPSSSLPHVPSVFDKSALVSGIVCISRPPRPTRLTMLVGYQSSLKRLCVFPRRRVPFEMTQSGALA